MIGFLAKSVDPILAAYLVAAGAPIIAAMAVWGWTSLLAYGAKRRSRRRQSGRCRHCGYDLRATPGGETLFHTCPECGQIDRTLP
jgi:hypothetical protein